MFMEIAGVIAKRSTCFRGNVGALVVHDNSIVSIGYNGPPAGEPHCTGKTCPTSNGCTRAIHAELNALERIPIGVAGDVDLYTTHSPCENCAVAIRNINKLTSGRITIKRLIFRDLYRINAHVKELFFHGITINQLTPSGYVIDFRTGELIDGG